MAFAIINLVGIICKIVNLMNWQQSINLMALLLNIIVQSSERVVFYDNYN